MFADSVFQIPLSSIQISGLEQEIQKEKERPILSILGQNIFFRKSADAIFCTHIGC